MEKRFWKDFDYPLLLSSSNQPVTEKDDIAFRADGFCKYM